MYIEREVTSKLPRLYIFNEKISSEFTTRPYSTGDHPVNRGTVFGRFPTVYLYLLSIIQIFR